jgi:GH24 family phage-related lysozyme (muramidase)
LQSDIRIVTSYVNRLVTVEINQNQFDALVDFTFNLGSGALAGSTLLKKLNAGDYEGAANEFKRWNHVNGKPSKGLTRRRAAEEKMFLGQDWKGESK